LMHRLRGTESFLSRTVPSSASCKPISYPINNPHV
jgi:hypothetical protein